MIQSSTTHSPLPLKWIPVLMYHRVVKTADAADPHFINITSAHFAEQMAYLRDHGYQPIALDDVPLAVGEHSSWSKPVAITFDDGYQDMFTHALPILQQFGMTATVMLVSDRIGGRNTWDAGKSADAPLLSLNEIKELANAGITFGAHTAVHSSLPDISLESARHELASSKHKLESLLGHEVSTLAYPYGRTTPEICRLAEEAGYTAAFGVDHDTHSLFNFNRIDSARYSGATRMWQLKVSGVYHSLRHNRGLKMLNRVRRQFTA
jgi:peptidoglycan/xylan/chitin deacetylase (PgdA/CDA1 family)